MELFLSNERATVAVITTWRHRLFRARFQRLTRSFSTGFTADVRRQKRRVRCRRRGKQKEKTAPASIDSAADPWRPWPWPSHLHRPSSLMSHRSRRPWRHCGPRWLSTTELRLSYAARPAPATVGNNKSAPSQRRRARDSLNSPTVTRKWRPTKVMTREFVFHFVKPATQRIGNLISFGHWNFSITSVGRFAPLSGSVFKFPWRKETPLNPRKAIPMRTVTAHIFNVSLHDPKLLLTQMTSHPFVFAGRSIKSSQGGEKRRLKAAALPVVSHWFYLMSGYTFNQFVRLV